jgi:hypothetical protein
MQTTLERPVPEAEVPVDRSRSERRFLFAGLSVAAIWLATLATVLWSPDMITGSEHEHLPIAAMTDWLYAAIATGLVLMAFSRRTRGATRSLWAGLTMAVATIWAVVALASLYAPTFITGSDPTTVPIAVLVAPVAGMTATAFVSIFAAGGGDGGAA